MNQNILKLDEISQTPSDKPANFKILNQRFTNKPCFTLTFNRSSTIMIGGFLNQIVIFGFENGMLKKKQVLITKAYTIYCMIKQNKFVSGGSNGIIRVWNLRENKLWEFEQIVLNGHTASVQQVIMNKKEDLIISCCTDGIINFSHHKKIWESFQVYDQKCKINSVCLNESENQLVSIGDSLIIYQQCEDGYWVIIQDIYIYCKGLRVAFIGDIYITTQLMCAQTLDIFKLDSENQQFERFKTVKLKKVGICSVLQPQSFNKQRQLLLNKNGCYLYLINNNFIIEQSIKLDDSDFRAVLSEDGQYLVTWDSVKNLLEVRQQQ